MSVARSGDGVSDQVADTYEKFEHEQVYLTHQISGQDASGNAGEKSSGEGDDLWHEWDPLDGTLDRNEVAELVMLIPTLFNGTTETSSGNNPGRLRYSFTFAHNEGNWLDESKATVDAANIANNTSSGSANGEFVQAVEPNAFYTATVCVIPPWSDTTNGTGGAGDYSANLPVYDYREMFGRGPLFDANDDIRASLDFHWDNAGNSNIETFTQWRYVWDIYEIDDPLTDIPRPTAALRNR